MQDLVLQIFNYLLGMWRFRWYAILAAWVVAIAGWVFVCLMPDQYEAHSKVQLDTDSILKPLLKDLAVDVDVTNQVARMTQVLASRPNLEKVIRDTDLDLRATTVKQRERLLASVQNRISISSPKINPRRRKITYPLYEISFSDSDPQIAYKVVQSLVNSLVEGTLGASRVNTDSAQKFLVRQIKEYEERLTEAEQRLADFKKKHVGLMPGQGGDYYERLQTAIQNLETSENTLNLTKKRRDALRQQLKGEAPIVGVDTNVQVIEQSLREHRNNLQKLLLAYTEEHPDVEAEKAIIAQLEKRLKTAKTNASINPAPISENDTAEVNPVYQQVKIALAQAEVEISTLEATIAAQKKKIDELNKLVDTIPDIEAQLARLNRDYRVTKTQHEELLARLESARLSVLAGQSSDDINFQIIEPPRVPITPTGPNRLLFFSAVLGAALAIALALSFLLDQLSPVIVSRDDLNKITDVPVLGSVSRICGPVETARRRRDHLLLSVAAAFLLIAYLLVIVLV